MTDSDRDALILATVAFPALWPVLLWCLPRRWSHVVAVVGGFVAGGLAVTVSAGALLDPTNRRMGTWIVLDAAGGLLVGVVGVVGLVAVLTSPAFLRTLPGEGRSRGRRVGVYYTVLYAFWATLLAVPLAGNLGAAWLLIEATTAASALLVGFSRKPRALEAAWKYLILTSLGLGIAMLGIALLATGIPGGGLGGLSWHTLTTYSSGRPQALVAYLLVLAGLAAKIGWAPVHNWLPDAHSQAPAPVSALLSAALLPSVLLVAWRCQQGLVNVVGPTTTQGVLILFGLVSMGVAVPFLSRPLAWKRLLAYSSLEHMGVIALGIGFANPLALAGVAIHITAHAIAKTLGFAAVTPLLAHDPRAADHAVSGVGRTRPALGVTMALCLGTLSGMPPSPLFASEILIIAGGFHAGHPWAAGLAAALLALAFLGLTHALLETTAGEAPTRDTTRPAGLILVTVLSVVAVVALLTLTVASVQLPDTDLVPAFLKGLR